MAVRQSTVYGFRMSLILIYFTALWKIESACREAPPPQTTAPVTPRPVLSRFTLSSLLLSSGRLILLQMCICYVGEDQGKKP